MADESKAELRKIRSALIRAEKRITSKLIDPVSDALRKKIDLIIEDIDKRIVEREYLCKEQEIKLEGDKTLIELDEIWNQAFTLLQQTLDCTSKVTSAETWGAAAPFSFALAFAVTMFACVIKVQFVVIKTTLFLIAAMLVILAFILFFYGKTGSKKTRIELNQTNESVQLSVKQIEERLTAFEQN